MAKRDWASIALLVAIGASVSARADTFSFGFKGSGVSGYVTLTYAPDPNTGVLPLTSPNPVDPIGAYIVTGAAGTITDTNIGFSDTITGAVPSNPAHPEPTNLYAPHSFGFYDIINGVAGPNGVAPGFSYDDLFYPGGSPRTASDYPFHGGFLDIYGLILTTAGGDAVNVWSNGFLNGPLKYGVGITDGTNVLEYATVSVPEPASWMATISGFGLMVAAMRRRRP